MNVYTHGSNFKITLKVKLIFLQHGFCIFGYCFDNSGITVTLTYDVPKSEVIQKCSLSSTSCVCSPELHRVSVSVGVH